MAAEGGDGSGPTIKIWGRPAAINVQKVLWCVDELGLAHERIDAGLHFGVVDTEAYRRLNPNGRIPTIEDDGLVLWESNAIVRYLCGRYGTPALSPGDPRQRADADRWMDWQATTLYYPTFREYYLGITRVAPEHRDKPKMARLHEGVVDHLRVLNAHLRERPYVAGEAFTMGDIPIGAVIDKWMRMPIERPPMAALERYHARLQERGPFRERVSAFAVDAV
jgi:glutathione S-transferase